MSYLLRIQPRTFSLRQFSMSSKLLKESGASEKSKPVEASQSGRASTAATFVLEQNLTRISKFLVWASGRVDRPIPDTMEREKFDRLSSLGRIRISNILIVLTLCYSGISIYFAKKEAKEQRMEKYRLYNLEKQKAQETQDS